MNAFATSRIRDLTGEELDQVVGGVRAEGGVVPNTGMEIFTVAWVGGMLGLAIASIFDWIFG